MRDKNPSFKQFYIQLDKTCLRLLESKNFIKFFASSVPATPTLHGPSAEARIRYPVTYRETRALCILHWWFPEFAFWQVHLDLQEKSFEHFNNKQQLELSLLLESKEICSTYLFESQRFTGSELFGNYLGNDALELSRTLKWQWAVPRQAKTKVRRRGYQDKGSRRPLTKWTPTSDWSLTEEQNVKERTRYHRTRTSHRLFKILRNISHQKDYDNYTEF